MSTATLNIASIELVSTQRVAPLNGSPSSADYNDSAREVLTDLASLSEFINGTVIPLLNCLPATDPLVLDGSAVYASAAATDDPLFFDATAQQPLTISSVFTKLSQIVASVQTQMTNVSAQVLALQTRLATTNQNDIATALQGLAATIAAVAARVTALGG